MRKGEPSATAEANAAFRAAEAMRPPAERISYDPFARDFLGLKFRIILGSRLLTKIALWYAERIIPGAPTSVVARTRYMDDYLEACIDDGIEQLVLLGAGYDSRAYRFDKLKGRIRVFEVDHPDTQRAKTEKIEKIFGGRPDGVVYVPVDFGSDKLDVRLFESTYDRGLKTLFIWEGVTPYLIPEAVDETLEFVARNSGKGSSIIFDYAFRPAVDGTSDQHDAQKWRRTFEQRGEPPRFGINQEDIDEFLTCRGFCQVKSVTVESLKTLYLKDSTGGRKLTGLGGIVYATVDSKGQM